MTRKGEEMGQSWFVQKKCKAQMTSYFRFDKHFILYNTKNISHSVTQGVELAADSGGLGGIADCDTS